MLPGDGALLLTAVLCKRERNQKGGEVTPQVIPCSFCNSYHKVGSCPPEKPVDCVELLPATAEALTELGVVGHVARVVGEDGAEHDVHKTRVNGRRVVDQSGMRRNT